MNKILVLGAAILVAIVVVLAFTASSDEWVTDFGDEQQGGSFMEEVIVEFEDGTNKSIISKPSLTTVKYEDTAIGAIRHIVKIQGTGQGYDSIKIDHSNFNIKIELVDTGVYYNEGHVIYSDSGKNIQWGQSSTEITCPIDGSYTSLTGLSLDFRKPDFNDIIQELPSGEYYLVFNTTGYIEYRGTPESEEGWKQADAPGIKTWIPIHIENPEAAPNAQCFVEFEASRTEMHDEVQDLDIEYTNWFKPFDDWWPF